MNYNKITTRSDVEMSREDDASDKKISPCKDNNDQKAVKRKQEIGTDNSSYAKTSVLKHLLYRYTNHNNNSNNNHNLENNDFQPQVHEENVVNVNDHNNNNNNNDSNNNSITNNYNGAH